MNALTVSIEDAGGMLGIGRTSIYALLRDGRLKRCKLGRRTLITVTSIEQLVERSAVQETQ